MSWNWVNRGIHYGYPPCCIVSFVLEHPRDYENRNHYYTGFIPCKKCNLEIFCYSDLVNRVRDRQCSRNFDLWEGCNCAPPNKTTLFEVILNDPDTLLLYFTPLNTMSTNAFSSFPLTDLKEETRKFIYAQAYLAACRKLSLNPAEVTDMSTELSKALEEEYAKLTGSVVKSSTPFNQELWKKATVSVGLKEDVIVRKSHPQYEQVLQYYRDHKNDA